MARFHATVEGSVPFTPEEELDWDSRELAVIQEQLKLSIKSDIAGLEATITPRRIREAILGNGGSWLAEQEAAIAALRAQL